MKYVIVENLETCPSPWLLTEYRYVKEVFPNLLVFTHVEGGKLREELSELAPTYRADFLKLITSSGLIPEEVIVLDPSASIELTPEDLATARAVVIGGIMGDSPMRGRTRKHITSKSPRLTPRNLGRGQLTIAGAAYVLRKVMEGYVLSEIELREGLEVRRRLMGVELVIKLPYTFPYENGEPVLPQNYLRIIAERSVYYESLEACGEGERPYTTQFLKALNQG